MPDWDAVQLVRTLPSRCLESHTVTAPFILRSRLPTSRTPLGAPCIRWQEPVGVNRLDCALQQLLEKRAVTTRETCVARLVQFLS